MHRRCCSKAIDFEQVGRSRAKTSCRAAVDAEDAAHPVRYETTAGTLTLYEEGCETRSGIVYPRAILEAHWQRRRVANETAYPDDHEQHPQEQRAAAIATGKRDVMASRQLLDADMQSREETKARYEARPCWEAHQHAEAQACEADEQEQKAWSRLLSAPCSTLSDVQAKAIYLLREANTPEHTIGAGKTASYDALVMLLRSLVAGEGDHHVRRPERPRPGPRRAARCLARPYRSVRQRTRRTDRGARQRPCQPPRCHQRAPDGRGRRIRDPIAFRLALARIVLFGAYLLLELSVVVSPDIEGPR
jgi:hypothetical protein